MKDLPGSKVRQCMQLELQKQPAINADLKKAASMQRAHTCFWEVETGEARLSAVLHERGYRTKTFGFARVDHQYRVLKMVDDEKTRSRVHEPSAYALELDAGAR